LIYLENEGGVRPTPPHSYTKLIINIASPVARGGNTIEQDQGEGRGIIKRLTG
jgi:hypothetical protein